MGTARKAKRFGTASLFLYIYIYIYLFVLFCCCFFIFVLLCVLLFWAFWQETLVAGMGIIAKIAPRVSRHGGQHGTKGTRGQLRMRDLADLRAKRPAIGKTLLKARVRQICSTVAGKRAATARQTVFYPAPFGRALYL